MPGSAHAAVARDGGGSYPLAWLIYFCRDPAALSRQRYYAGSGIFTAVVAFILFRSSRISSIRARTGLSTSSAS